MNPENNKNESLNFSDLAQGESSGEICRIFIACLQLANLGNISLNDPTTAKTVDKKFKHVNDQYVNNNLKLNLLSCNKHIDINNYRAPSLVNE